MPFVLPFTIRPDEDIDAYAPCRAHLSEVVAAFADGGPALTTHLAAGSSAAEPDRPRHAPPTWRRFLHGAPLIELDARPAGPTHWPDTLKGTIARTEWFTQRYAWAIIGWPNTYGEYVAAFVSGAPELAERFERSWRQHPHTGAWDKPQADEHALTLLGAYQTDHPARSFRIALYSEWTREGEALWDLIDCETNRPLMTVEEYAQPSTPFTPVNWTPLGFEAVSDSTSSTWHGTIVHRRVLRPVSREALFRFLRLESGDERPANDNESEADGTTFVLWRPQPGDGPDALQFSGGNGCLAELSRAMAQAEWLHTRHHGGGTGEYYNIFAASDARLTRRLIDRIEQVKDEGFGISALY